MGFCRSDSAGDGRDLEDTLDYLALGVSLPLLVGPKIGLSLYYLNRR